MSDCFFSGELLRPDTTSSTNLVTSADGFLALVSGLVIVLASLSNPPNENGEVVVEAAGKVGLNPPAAGADVVGFGKVNPLLAGTAGTAKPVFGATILDVNCVGLIDSGRHPPLVAASSKCF